MKIIAPLILVLSLTIATFSMHFGKRVDTMINDKNSVISESYLQYAVELHKTETTFQKRPLTTLLIEKVAGGFDITIGLSFILVNFSLLALSALLLYKLSRVLGANQKYAMINMVVYFLCFSNLYAFFEPVYSYDEPLQFCLIFLSLIFLFSEKPFLFVIAFSLSLIARESTMLLMPAMALFLIARQNSERVNYLSWSYLKRFGLLVIPFLVYVIFIFAYISMADLGAATSNDLSLRINGFANNFETPIHSQESIISIFIVLGVPLYLVYYTLKYRTVTAQQMKFINAFLLTAIINTMVVLLFTRAREVRLFAIPLFFIWPLFSTLFKEEIKLICAPSNYIKLFMRWKYLLFFLFFNFLNYMISFEMYDTTVGGDDYFSEYLFVLLFIVIAHVFITDLLHKKTRVEILP